MAPPSKAQLSIVRNNSLFLKSELQAKKEEKMEGQPIPINKNAGRKASNAGIIKLYGRKQKGCKESARRGCKERVQECRRVQERSKREMGERCTLLESEAPNKIKPDVNTTLPRSLLALGPTLFMFLSKKEKQILLLKLGYLKKGLQEEMWLQTHPHKKYKSNSTSVIVLHILLSLLLTHELPHSELDAR
jgi:hypothetical protein